MAKLDLNLMAVLEAIYDEGNTSKAAETLHLSQPAVSHALNRLRSIYNDPLFSRQGHSMMPSPLTERIIVQVKHGLQELRRSVDDAHEFVPTEHQQTFRISQRDAMETLLLPELISRVENLAPHIKLTSTNSSPQTVAEQLNQGQVDLCLELGVAVPESLHNICLFKDPLVVVGRHNHPYFQRNTESEQEATKALLSYAQVLVSPLQNASEWIDRALEKQGLKREVQLRCASYPSALNTLLNSDKLSIMPGAYIKAQQKFYPLQTAPLPFSAPELEIHLYWHSRHHHDPASSWLRQQLVLALSDLALVTLEDRVTELVKG